MSYLCRWLEYELCRHVYGNSWRHCVSFLAGTEYIHLECKLRTMRSTLKFAESHNAVNLQQRHNFLRRLQNKFGSAREIWNSRIPEVNAQHSKREKIYQPQIAKAISQTPACDLDQKWLKPRFPFSLHGFFVLESLHDRAPKTRENEKNVYALRYLWGQSRKQTKWWSSIELEKSLGERYHVISWWARSKSKKTFSNTKWAYSRWVLLILSRFECISTQCCRNVWATVHKEVCKTLMLK